MQYLISFFLDFSSYSCRGVFPLINCMVEQVMGGTRGPSDGGALFKVCHSFST